MKHSHLTGVRSQCNLVGASLDHYYPMAHGVAVSKPSSQKHLGMILLGRISMHIVATRE